MPGATAPAYPGGCSETGILPLPRSAPEVVAGNENPRSPGEGYPRDGDRKIAVFAPRFVFPAQRGALRAVMHEADTPGAVL